MSDHYHDHEELSQEVQADLERLAECLGQLHDPVSGLALDKLDAKIEVGFEAGGVFAGITLGYPCAGEEAGWRERVLTACEPLLKGGPLAGSGVQFELFSDIPANSVANAPESLCGVKNIVAVASGKGGVGKSTTAVNLALALMTEGARVGLLDADIYGPSLPTMLGTEGVRPQVKEQKCFVPVTVHGIETMSLGYLMTEDTPVVWRGPMASGALNQILTQTLWCNAKSELDYLIVDMPPGTGDIQLTLAQKTTMAGAVIVTTPQDLALKDAIKGVEMFRKVSVPVLGIVENMALHTCSKCGHSEPVFGTGGGARIAEQYSTHLLGALPLAQKIREDADSGCPSVIADPEGEIATFYRQIARRMAAGIWLNSTGDEALPEIEIS
ncbi:iron-sulfur cluster carrier protein ApbC [Microbulbifer sp. 2205BS26-8]|uniref:iron-sulfur cluster carrier protein ApbC n=1 Tax=Microbulbifer sp. 2205BS26-8 TaxID=3064386 RepID=UPI00273EB1E7|nr:iron-sulfur cluster carrier protein ApbC [Microbulbifer sp. 2205BS26-8]MDP5209397.1 iron-sulfur cluster carrier protein ApbC [Microbulbifer sp. 2205BS26-8]